MTAIEVLKKLELYDLVCLKNIARGEGKTNLESLRTLQELDLITWSDRWVTTTLGAQVLKAHSDRGRR